MKPQPAQTHGWNILTPCGKGCVEVDASRYGGSPMNDRAACRTYNVLVNERRRAAAALIL